MRGSADRHYGKQNALTLEFDNIHLIAEYRMVIHTAISKTARYLYNASGLATSFNSFKTFGFQKFPKLMFPTITSTCHKLNPAEFLKSLGEHVQQIQPI